MATFTKAQEERIAEILRGVLGEFAPAQAAPAAPSEASAHWRARDLACTKCTKTFRTVKGRDWHIANAHR